jgi:hypothetical protein
MKQEHTILDLGKDREPEGLPVSHPLPPRWLCQQEGERKTIHLAGLGDVGGTVLIGLSLLGGDVIESLGIYDLNENQCSRWEMELNQIAAPFGTKRIPPTTILSEETLFDCDVFAFCVAKAVPAVGSNVGDVRMAQFEANRAIVSWYAKKAADAHFQGLFLVISDPVDLLCKAAFLGAKEGAFPLHPGQIQGCGLGVMNARASYYAKKDPAFSSYLTEGRAFGPHGKDLVLANSIEKGHYDDALSRSLTDLAVTANLKVRDAGFKPYIAPALSSAALTILLILKGEWNYSSNYLNGVYFGAKNRTTPEGTQWEILPLPEPLFARLSQSYEHLREIL